MQDYQLVRPFVALSPSGLHNGAPRGTSGHLGAPQGTFGPPVQHGVAVVISMCVTHAACHVVHLESHDPLWWFCFIDNVPFGFCDFQSHFLSFRLLKALLTIVLCFFREVSWVWSDWHSNEFCILHPKQYHVTPLKKLCESMEGPDQVPMSPRVLVNPKDGRRSSGQPTCNDRIESLKLWKAVITCNYQWCY